MILPLFLCFFLQAAPPVVDKSLPIEKQLALLVVAAIVGGACKWFFDYLTGRGSNRRDDARLLMEVQDKLAVWIEKFQLVKIEVNRVEDENRILRNLLQDCLELLVDSEEIHDLITQIFTKVEKALKELEKQKPMADTVREVRTDLQAFRVKVKKQILRQKDQLEKNVENDAK